MYYFHEHAIFDFFLTFKMLENVLKRSEFVYSGK